MSAVLAGPFPPCLRCVFLSYIQYACEATPWPDAKFLADHSCQRAACSPNRGVQVQRPGRPSQRAKLPQRPKAPSADGAIPGQGPWSAPPPLRGGRRRPSTNAAPSATHPRTGANAPRRAVQSLVGRGIPDAPTPHPIRGRQGCRPLRRFWSAVQRGGGTHRSCPTESEHIGLSGFRRNGPNASRRAVQSLVGRGIPDAPTPHPIRGRQGCRPLRRWWSAVQHGGGTHRSRPTFSVSSLSVLSDGKSVPASLRQWYYGTFWCFPSSPPVIWPPSKKYFSFFPGSTLFLVQPAQIPLFSGCHIVTLPFLL